VAFAQAKSNKLDQRHDTQISGRSQRHIDNELCYLRPAIEALSLHLKHEIRGLIPITVKGSKALRALNCVPVWQSANVCLPPPDDGTYAWGHEYLQELLNFPNATHDDQVDATTLALNQLRGTLFPESKECVAPA
jgi:hypothetical protein